MFLKEAIGFWMLVGMVGLCFFCFFIRDYLLGKKKRKKEKLKTENK